MLYNGNPAMIARPGGIERIPMSSLPGVARQPYLGMANPRIRGSFKKGGKVKMTGAYMLHKGEKVVSTKMQKAMPMKKALAQAMGKC